MSKLLWQPNEKIINKSNIKRFIDFVNKKESITIKDYSDLYQWSIDDVGNFWLRIWEFSEIISSNTFSKVVENLTSFPPQTKWFPGSTLNFAENLLKFRDDKIAIISQRETDDSVSITYRELYDKVAKLYISLKNLNLKPGDRVVAYAPNIPETLITMLAATSLGCTWASCGVELGAVATIDRLNQIGPRVIISVDAYIYKGKEFNHLNKIKQVSDSIESLEKVIIIPYVNANPDLSEIKNSILYNDFVAKSVDIKIEFEQLSFSHPLYIMFSSGTTGKPKCMVQSAGGVLINHLKELVLHTDLKRDDKILYLTSPSWMMWNWLMSALATGTTLVLFDGNPLYPNWEHIFNILEKHKISVFGCSASYLHHLKNIDANPRKEFDLSYLREISQTGSALSPEGFEYVYNNIKSDLHLNSISGGTDINGCFAGGVITEPIYSGQLQRFSLGMKVVAYDDNGNSILDNQGELVCELPSPSMPIYFWNDPDNEKYNSAYFNYYEKKKVWRHGDYIVVDSKTKGITFSGRSDSTLKPSGVRIGTSEIYNIVEDLPQIIDSLAIGQTIDGDQRVLLFVQLNDDTTFNIELEKIIRSELRSKASPRHVPQLIFQVADIPYTFSGKKVESAVTNIVNNRKVTNRGALRNPESLDIYIKLKDKLI